MNNLPAPHESSSKISANQLPRWLIWGITFPLIVLNGWVLLIVLKYFQPLVSIFISAALLAFVLDYPINFFQRRGLNRIIAIAFVLLLTIVIVVAVGFTLVPVIFEQLYELTQVLPSWIDSGTEKIEAFQGWILQQEEFPINVGGLITQALDRLSTQFQSFTGKILGFAVDTISTIVNVLLTIVLTIYMVLNGEKLWDGIFQWFNPKIGTPIRQLIREDFQNYFIGQATIGAILSVLLTLSFWVLKVPLGLLFGITIGFFSLFPFGTGIGISLVVLLVGLQNFWLGLEVLIVAIATDQINSNVIAPRLLSNLTGLNPIWVVISLLLGAKFAGILGLLVAIPIASFIKDVADIWRSGEFNLSTHVQPETNPNITTNITGEISDVEIKKS
ncbi:AI-2E family transporter [Calothrix sp. NIES-3974]|uniref:AI-2E family transporter n=1 Tax=Calothrix sp. NIES-3974 TaxID=2005462 RepID=UPI000B5EDBF3|nr:AI-2E family transporter [Calothrix sp. NIES-3974]BAZ07116.1 hypothetical protein NIES3974_37790 [Calothrix sp. NIES-3974]